MIQLFIENKLVFIDDTVRFPFSHKINDLNNFDIIGLEKSKTISIKKCSQNDDIFGHLGDIQRLTFNYDDDNKIGVSFNQTKNISYVIRDDGETVSQGKVIIENITSDNYEVTLYDNLIFLLETFEGDSQTGDGYLNSLDILDYNGNAIEFNNYATNIKNLNDKALVPTFNITNDDLNDTSFRCIDKSNGDVVTFELDGAMSQLQTRSIKGNQAEYATPINSVIESINYKYGDVIEIDPKLDKYFNELHMFLGKPKVIDKVRDDIELAPLSNVTKLTLTPNDYATVNYQTVNNVEYGIVGGINKFYYPLKNTLDNSYIQKRNGKYYIELPITLILKSKEITTYLSTFKGKNYTTSNIKAGDEFANYYLKTKICTYVPGALPNLGNTSEVNITTVNNKLDFILGVNSEYNIDIDNKPYITVYKTLVLEFDYYPAFTPASGEYLAIQFDIEKPQEDSALFGYNNLNGISFFRINHTINLAITTDSERFARCEYNSFDKIYTGDLIKGSTLYPKIAIKTFLLNLTKFHNLELVNNDGKLLIRKKLYNITDEQLNIINTNSVNTKMFEFSKMSITTELSDNDLIKTYENVSKQKYGQKNIDLNYSIRKNVNEIKYDVSIPAFAKDTNKIAYDSFGDYYNAGRKKNATGVCNGLDNKITFCFVNQILDDQIWITNDTLYEAGIFSGDEIATPTEVKFVKTNWLVVKDGNKYKFFDAYTSDFLAYDIYTALTQSIKLNTYCTASPYKFNGSNVIKSLEINKPKYNYANLTDEIYPESATHYDRYLKRQIEDIYSPNTHILDCDIIFNNKPDIYKIYNYQNVNYIISELQEFEIGGGLSNGVKLLKINDTNNYINPYGKEEGYLKVNFFDLIDKNSIRVNNLIEYTGGDTIATGGVNYGLTSTNLNDNMTISNPGTNFSISVIGLVKNTNYYFRPYMVSSTGIYTYGEIKEVRTLDDLSIPTLVGISTTNVTYTSATVTGLIQSEGGYSITEYGLVYSDAPNPNLESNIGKIIIGNSAVYTNFTYNLLNLAINTSYYVRFYAINQNGTGYSNNLLFSTLTATLPSITTATIDEVIAAGGAEPTPVGMTGGGYNIQLNGGTLIRKGWVAKIDSEPTYNDYDIWYRINTTTNTDGFVGYSVTSLNEVATMLLYYRAFVTTDIGTSYGEIVYVSMPNYSAPKVTTNEITNITTTGATLSGTFNSNGYDPLLGYGNLGFVYSINNTNPTVGSIGCIYVTVNSVATEGSTKTKVITGLNSNTVYYVRAVGVNSIGYGYGQSYQFFTLGNPPTIDWPIMERAADYDESFWASFNIDLNGGYTTYGGGIVYAPTTQLPVDVNDFTPEMGYSSASIYTITNGYNQFYFTNMIDLSNYQVGEISFRFWANTDFGKVWSSVGVETYR